MRGHEIRGNPDRMGKSDDLLYKLKIKFVNIAKIFNAIVGRLDLRRGIVLLYLKFLNA